MPERTDRVIERVNAAAGFGQTQMGQRVRLVESDHLAKYFDGFRVAPLRLEMPCDLVVRRERVAGEVELAVDLSQLWGDVQVL